MYDDVAPPAEGETPSGAPDTEAVGPYQRSDEELVKQVRLWFKEASDAKVETAKKRRDDWRMVGGDQWDDADTKVYERQKRPILTLNMVLPIVSAVEGEERTNRQEIKYFGEGKEDDAAAHGLNRILKWVLNQCGGQFALSQQFRSMVVCGEGWIVPEVDYFDDPEGKLTLLYVDDDECFDDPLAKSPVSADSRYLHRVRMMTQDEGEGRWPGFREKVRQASLAGDAGPETDGKGYRDIYSTPNDTKSPKLYDAEKKLWAVLETWWHQIEPGWIVVDEATGGLVEKTDAEFEALKMQREEAQRTHLQAMIAGTLQPVQPAQVDPLTGATIAPATMPQMPPAIDAKRRPIKRIYQAFTCYDVLLGKSASPLKAPNGDDLKRFPYVPARAIYDKIAKEWRGLVRDLIDPQKQHNVEQSIIVQLMQLMPKSAWMGPKGSFHNKAEWQEKAAQPGAMLEYNASRGKPEQIQPPAIPRHLIDMAFTRPQTMREISGVNVELQGVRQGSDPGIVMEMRTKAAKTVLAPIFDNFRQAKHEIGRVLLAYIQTYVPPGRRLRVLGEDGPAYVEMTEQMQLGRYDLAVEETNSTVNDRVATLNILQTTMPQMVKAGMSITPEFVDLMPMPPHIRDAWKRQISWDMTLAGRLPPPGWNPGDPIPLPAPQPGLAPPAGEPIQ